MEFVSFPHPYVFNTPADGIPLGFLISSYKENKSRRLLELECRISVGNFAISVITGSQMYHYA